MKTIQQTYVLRNPHHQNSASIFQHKSQNTKVLPQELHQWLSTLAPSAEYKTPFVSVISDEYPEWITFAPFAPL